MKKIVIPISVLSLVAVGIILSLPQDEIVLESENTPILQTTSKEENKNQNTNQNKDSQEDVYEKEYINSEENIIAEEDKIITTASTLTGEIVNPITGESHPASYYDEVLADGYTYNNPAPIPEDWIIEPATDEYPATLDYDRMRATVSESYLLPGRISTMFSMVPEHMHGYTPRILFLRNEKGFNDKKEFLDWLRQYTDADIYFISESKYNNRDGGKTWNIFMTEETMDTIYDSYSKLKMDSTVSTRPWNQYLPQYRDTKELQDAIDATHRAMEL